MNLLNHQYKEKGVLIAAHRGTNGGNVLQNTSKAYLNAIRHKADMFEVDVVRSNDGKFFAFHDGQEPLVFRKEIDLRKMDAEEIERLVCYNSLNEPIHQKIEQVSSILERFQGDTLINIDRSWFYWDTFLDELKSSPALNQILLKSPVKTEYLELLKKSGLEVMYMPIVKTKEELDLVLNYEGINTVAVELVFEDSDSELIEPALMDQLHDKGLLLWVNALTLSDDIILSAKIDDDSAIENDGKSWGELAQMGFDIIQTDWPYLLYDYLVKNNYKK